MALISYYDQGSATVAADGTAITGQGTQWLGSVRPGDLFAAAGLSERILSVNSNTSLTLARGWPGSARTAAAYEVRKTPPAAEMTASVRELLEKLRQGLWLTPNATGTLAERAAFDRARRGFIYMRTDVSPFLVYVKATDDEGDWSEGYAPQQGPSGPFTTIEIGETTTLAPGSEATIDPVQVGDVVTLNFGIPAGTVIQAGTTTTLAPDQPASVDFSPIAGGFELNFNIPRGPTGDIDGVTPFWVTRLGADVDAAAARIGMGLDDAANIPDLPASKVTTGSFVAARIPTNLDPTRAFRRGNILGTVSQASGVPTGAIIERGSNANGEYVRFADGAQIAWVDNLVGTQQSSAQIAIPWTRPVAFIAGSVGFAVLPSAISNYTGVARSDAFNLTCSGTGTINMWSTGIPTGANITSISAVQIGRWF